MLVCLLVELSFKVVFVVTIISNLLFELRVKSFDVVTLLNSFELLLDEQEEFLDPVFPKKLVILNDIILGFSDFSWAT